MKTAIRLSQRHLGGDGTCSKCRRLFWRSIWSSLWADRRRPISQGWRRCRGWGHPSYSTHRGGWGGLVALMPDPALAPDEKSRYGYIRDRLGRQLKKDEFEYIVRPTARPKGVPIQTWRKVGSAERKITIARLQATEEAAAPTAIERPETGPPSGSAREETPPAVAAEEVEWNYDTSIGDVELSMVEIDSWGEFYLNTCRSICTHQNGGESHNLCLPPYCIINIKTKRARRTCAA